MESGLIFRWDVSAFEIKDLRRKMAAKNVLFV
jgi:hypothetical protein